MLALLPIKIRTSRTCTADRSSEPRREAVVAFLPEACRSFST